MKSCKRILGCVTAIFISALCLPSAAAAFADYDLATDWTSIVGGVSPWSYGKYDGSSLDGAFSTFTQHRIILTTLSEQYNGPDDPNIIKNLGSTFTTACCDEITFHADAVTFGPFNGPTVARWTAPSDGTYLVDAVFATVQVGNSAPNAYIRDGTALIDLGVVPEFGVGTVEYHALLTLAAGQNVDFVVWGLNVNNKTTEVSASISSVVPEPSAAVLFSVGAVLVLRSARRHTSRAQRAA